MNGDLTFLAALTAGLVGSAHCMGMCGGIAAALGMSAREAGGDAVSTAGYTLLFSVGRLIGYAMIGALAGLIGGGLAAAVDVALWALIARVLTGLLLVAIGLQIAFHLRLLAPIEQSGARFWSRLAPIARRLLPVRRPHQAIGLGMLWGWLPCGLVYSMVLMAMLAGDPLRSALLMASFGLGTLPAMTTTGLLSSRLSMPTRGTAWRRLAGILLIGFGLWTAAVPINRVLGGGEHHHGQHAVTTTVAGHQGLLAESTSWRLPSGQRSLVAGGIAPRLVASP